jgi:Domain of unknown function (DUF4419)
VRNKFVSFSGQQDLKILIDDSIIVKSEPDVLLIENNGVDKICNLFMELLVTKVKDSSLCEWVVPNFSTTTETARLAGVVVLFSTMKQYFKFTCTVLCGIPQFTLRGTVADWENIEQRIKRLLEFDHPYLRNWYSMLAPILRQFTESAKGNIDINFWQQIVKYQRLGSGSQQGLNGWASVFSVFDCEGNWMGEIDNGKTWPNIQLEAISTGICSVPLKIITISHEYNCQLLAGHGSFAVLNKNTIKPCIDWGLIDIHHEEKAKLRGKLKAEKELQQLKQKYNMLQNPQAVFFNRK